MGCNFIDFFYFYYVWMFVFICRRVIQFMGSLSQTNSQDPQNVRGVWETMKVSDMSLMKIKLKKQLQLFHSTLQFSQKI